MLDLFQAIENVYDAATGSAIGTALNVETWLFAVIQAVHLLTLTVLGCAVLVVDLRLIGIGMRRLPAARVAAEARPWLLWGMAGQVITGLLLFASLAATKYYGLPPFRLKMYLLLAALLVTFVVRPRVIAASGGRDGWRVAATGVVSIALWSGVALLAKGITFY